MNKVIKQSADSVARWVEDRNYKGYDPGDGLTSWLRQLAFGNLLGERILQQFIWKFPVNVRPLIGVRPLESTKGRGFMAWGYLFMHRATGHAHYKERAIECLKWLDQEKERTAVGHCWGNHFDFSTRSGCMIAHTPTIVWSGLIGQAFLDAYEFLGETHFLDIAQSICRWILKLPREVTDRGSCLSYTSVGQSSVHNANFIGAALLARTWAHRPLDEYMDVATSAVKYSCDRQRADGSWWYGEDLKYRWIDGFHTAYNLDSLKRFAGYSGNASFTGSLSLGYQYFKKSFFCEEGCPKYYHNRVYPVDIQCAAQAIDTFCLFRAHDNTALEQANKVAYWTISNMRNPNGSFYYRKYPFLVAKTPYFHWGQSTMFKALAHLFASNSACPEKQSDEFRKVPSI